MHKMRIRRIATVLLMLFLLTLVPVHEPVFAQSTSVTRIAGEDRYETAVTISQNSYGSASTVILVSGEGFADALAAGPLSYRLSAPILLVRSSGVPKVVIDEVQRLGATRIIIIGGEAAIGDRHVARAFPRMTRTRLAGENRYETAAKVVRYMGVAKIGITTGQNFPDGLSAGPYLGKQGAGLALSNGTSVHASLRGYTQSYAFGGKEVVNTPQFNGRRLEGIDRYLTALAVAKDGYPNTNTVILASGTDYPDALSAVSLAKKHNAPILLTNGQTLRGEIRDYIKGKHLIVIGGGAAISDAHIQDITKAPAPKPQPTPKPTPQPTPQPSPSRPYPVDDQGYTILSGEKELRDFMLDAFNRYETNIKLRYGTRRTNLLNDVYPMIYGTYIFGQLGGGSDCKVSTNMNPVGYDCTIDYVASPEELVATERYINDIARRIKAESNDPWRQLELSHIHMATTFNYDRTLTIYDVPTFVKTKSGVCYAYAWYYGKLLETMGFEVNYIESGYASYEPGGPAGHHAWVEVKYNGRWYTTDPTWSAYGNASTVNWRYFMMDEKTAIQTHKKD